MAEVVTNLLSLFHAVENVAGRLGWAARARLRNALFA
jgi:hypothetical protein